MARPSKLATKSVAVALPAAVDDGRRRNARALKLGELDEHIGYFARRFQVWIFQDLIQTLASAGIRISHYSVLVIINANPGLANPRSPTWSALSRPGSCASSTSLNGAE